MNPIKVFKFSASGNLFVLVDLRDRSSHSISMGARQKLAQFLSKEFSSDGVLFISDALRSTQSAKLVFFNPDGSRTFCGNGTRTAGFYEVHYIRKKTRGIVSVVTDAGKIQVEVDGARASLLNVEMPKYLGSVKLSTINYQLSTFHKVFSGCPHAVTFVKDLDKIDVGLLGKVVRYHKGFAPDGTNVDFVKIVNSRKLKARTYERGVESETASCGSGVLAVASVAKKLNLITASRFVVEMPGGSFTIKCGSKEKISMGSEVKLLFKGEAYV